MSSTMETIKPHYKAGYVAIVGEPNVGKSTLLNALLEQKISIVTNKPQTTRQRVLGILSRDDAQIVFLDTPGLLKPKYLLHKEMVRSAEIDYFKEIIPISALRHDNLDAIEQTLIQYLPEHEAFYPLDIVSESPERFFVAEFIREQLFEKFSEEIPYSTAVEIRAFKERETGKTLISADIIVERESQKGIVIGKKG